MACIYLLNSRGGTRSFDFDITYFYPIIVTPYYKKHIVRKQIGDFQPPIPAEGVHKMARYAYAITYVEDDEADVLPVNFESAMSRHLSLRKSTASLSSAAKAEFSKRLTQGVKRGFWSIQEVDKMRALGSGAHFLPAGFVLKDPAGSASTKV